MSKEVLEEIIKRSEIQQETFKIIFKGNEYVFKIFLLAGLFSIM